MLVPMTTDDDRECRGANRVFNHGCMCPDSYELDMAGLGQVPETIDMSMFKSTPDYLLPQKSTEWGDVLKQLTIEGARTGLDVLKAKTLPPGSFTLSTPVGSTGGKLPGTSNTMMWGLIAVAVIGAFLLGRK